MKGVQNRRVCTRQALEPTGDRRPKSHGYNNVGILNDGSFFGDELTADALADMKAAGLKLVKEVTCSPTSVVLTTQARPPGPNRSRFCKESKFSLDTRVNCGRGCDHG